MMQVTSVVDMLEDQHHADKYKAEGRSDFFYTYKIRVVPGRFNEKPYLVLMWLILTQLHYEYGSSNLTRVV
jgi:hypothetical protein